MSTWFAPCFGVLWFSKITFTHICQGYGYSLHVPVWLLKWLNLITAPDLGATNTVSYLTSNQVFKKIHAVIWGNHSGKQLHWDHRICNLGLKSAFYDIISTFSCLIALKDFKNQVWQLSNLNAPKHFAATLLHSSYWHQSGNWGEMS